VNPATNLPELIHQLGSTYSPYERLKILGRAWSLLRTMTTDQRLAVAAHLGLDKADEVVEAIAARTGDKPSPALLAMIEQAQVKGTAHLPTLIADLRDPKRRRERLKESAAAVEDALLGNEVPAATWLPPGAVPPVPGAAVVEGGPRTVAKVAAAPPIQPIPPAPQPAPPPAPAPVVASPAPAPPPPVVKVAPPPEPKPVEAPPPPKPQPAPAPVPPVQAAPDSGLVDRLAAIPSLTLRFRVFRGQLNEARGMSTAGLRSIIEGFPDGWARRRALLELLRAGIPGAIPDALALVEALASERDRLWCLGALTDTRTIPPGDREAVLAGVTSPAARRRLAGRMGGAAA
jgi:hypothetical protein